MPDVNQENRRNKINHGALFNAIIFNLGYILNRSGIHAAENHQPSKSRRTKTYGKSAATELMEFFYSVHYEIGTALEDVVRADVLSRQQRQYSADPISGRRWLADARKDIESNVQRWFEVTSAALSKSLRAMMRPPLELIEITEAQVRTREAGRPDVQRRGIFRHCSNQGRDGVGGIDRRRAAQGGGPRDHLLPLPHRRVSELSSAQPSWLIQLGRGANGESKKVGETKSGSREKDK